MSHFPPGAKPIPVRQAGAKGPGVALTHRPKRESFNRKSFSGFPSRWWPFKMYLPRETPESNSQNRAIVHGIFAVAWAIPVYEFPSCTVMAASTPSTKNTKIKTQSGCMARFRSLAVFCEGYKTIYFKRTQKSTEIQGNRLPSAYRVTPFISHLVCR
jgi:hypothetical protein